LKPLYGILFVMEKRILQVKFMRVILPPIINGLIIFFFGVVLASFQFLPAKIFIILLFFLYNLYFLIFHQSRDLAMILLDLDWRQSYPLKNKIAHLVLYTASFASIFYYLIFPFDLLLINIFVLQFPTILLKESTFQERLAGNMQTVLRY